MILRPADRRALEVAVRYARKVGREHLRAALRPPPPTPRSWSRVAPNSSVIVDAAAPEARLLFARHAFRIAAVAHLLLKGLRPRHRDPMEVVEYGRLIVSELRRRRAGQGGCCD